MPHRKASPDGLILEKCFFCKVMSGEWIWQNKFFQQILNFLKNSVYFLKKPSVYDVTYIYDEAFLKLSLIWATLENLAVFSEISADKSKYFSRQKDCCLLLYLYITKFLSFSLRTACQVFQSGIGVVFAG